MASAEQALSIDNIVDGLEDKKVELVAKLGIVRAIHMSEKESNYFSIDQRTRRLDFRKFDTTWYSHLTKLICENRRVGELDKVFENLSFISFNYDRCIEAYLPWSIANYYQVNLDQVLEPFLKLSIHRPYGIAGEIDFRRARNEGPMGFGGNGVQYLAEAGSQIRTFTEGVENPERLDDLRRDISQADRIVFLGSAFHRQNLELLQTKIKEDAHVLATTGQISDPDLSVIRRELGEIFSIPSFMIEGRIVFAKMYCREFFETHWRTLTSG